MPYGTPVTRPILSTYEAVFIHTNGTLITLTFYDESAVGPTSTTNDDFQAAIDLFQASPDWSLDRTAYKTYPTREIITPS